MHLQSLAFIDTPIIDNVIMIKLGYECLARSRQKLYELTDQTYKIPVFPGAPAGPAGPRDPAKPLGPEGPGAPCNP
jgi:hypothetical protein